MNIEWYHYIKLNGKQINWDSLAQTRVLFKTRKIWLQYMFYLLKWCSGWNWINIFSLFHCDILKTYLSYESFILLSFRPVHTLTNVPFFFFLGLTLTCWITMEIPPCGGPWITLPLAPVTTKTVLLPSSLGEGAVLMPSTHKQVWPITFVLWPSS